MKHKLVFGIPTFGTQPPDWSIPMMANLHDLGKSDEVEVVPPYIINAVSMATDHNRNDIVERFLKTDADWLMWVDADNTIPIGGIQRLLNAEKTMVTGIYVTRSDTPKPVAYLRNEDGTYSSLRDWRTGEIVPVDAAGMGCALIHRSVFEDIRSAFRAVLRQSGGITLVHKDDIVGDIFDDTSSDSDNKIVDGVLHQRIRLVRGEYKFPYFALEFGRTEDYWFFELAKRAGHELWCDTSVTVGHIRTTSVGVSDYRKAKK